MRKILFMALVAVGLNTQALPFSQNGPVNSPGSAPPPMPPAAETPDQVGSAPGPGTVTPPHKTPHAKKANEDLRPVAKDAKMKHKRGPKPADPAAADGAPAGEMPPPPPPHHHGATGAGPDHEPAMHPPLPAEPPHPNPPVPGKGAIPPAPAAAAPGPIGAPAQ